MNKLFLSLALAAGALLALPGCGKKKAKAAAPKKEMKQDKGMKKAKDAGMKKAKPAEVKKAMPKKADKM